MRLIDSHCHLDFPNLSKDLTEHLRQATAVGVEKIIVPAVQRQYFDQVLQLSQQYDHVYPALGLHPLWIDRHQPQDLTDLEQIITSEHSPVVAIGEIGLDRYQPNAAQWFTQQLALLDAQFALARQCHLPVILHSRRTHDVLLKRLRQAALPATGVVHGFSGSYQQAKQFIDLGYRLGMGGTITYPRANKTRHAFARLPLDCLLLETDAPDMPLFGYQGQVNCPQRVAAIFECFCQLRVEPAALIAEQLWQNTLALFPRLDCAI